MPQQLNTNIRISGDRSITKYYLRLAYNKFRILLKFMSQKRSLESQITSSSDNFVYKEMNLA